MALTLRTTSTTVSLACLYTVELQKENRLFAVATYCTRRFQGPKIASPTMPMRV